MARLVGVAVLIVACGTRASPPPPVVVPVDARIAPAALHDRAGRLRALAKALADDKPLADARAAIIAFGAKTRFRPERLDGAIVASAALAASFERAAATLDDPRATGAQIADALDHLGTDVTGAFSRSLGTLTSELADETVFERDHVCPAAGSDCEATVRATFDALSALHPRIRRELDAAAEDAERAFPALDAHGRAGLLRAAGHGPGAGQPCGPEDVCRWDHQCMPATKTCERGCTTVAMDPCPGNRACVTIPKLDGTYCR